jgi:hypothetical protein
MNLAVRLPESILYEIVQPRPLDSTQATRTCMVSSHGCAYRHISSGEHAFLQLQFELLSPPSSVLGESNNSQTPSLGIASWIGIPVLMANSTHLCANSAKDICSRAAVLERVSWAGMVVIAPFPLSSSLKTPGYGGHCGFGYDKKQGT